MASNLRVDSIVPSTGTNVSIGTATGGVNIPGDLGIAGVLTYEDVTNIDSVGVITARDGLRVTGITTITSGNIQINAGGNTTQAIFSGNGGSGARGLSIITESVGAQDEGVILNARASGTTGRIKLQTNSTTALTIDGSGSNGNITANTGHIIIGTAGKGIDYSAQTVGGIAGVSVTSEILVHYEEGTFTPFISASSSAPSVSYGAERGGKYTRIGDVVFYSLGMNLASYSGGSGNVYIGGFPYVGTGTPGWDGAHVFRDSGAIALNSRINQLGAWMETSAVAGYPILYIQSHSGTSNFGASYVQASSISTGRITVHGHYKIG